MTSPRQWFVVGLMILLGLPLATSLAGSRASAAGSVEKIVAFGDLHGQYDALVTAAIDLKLVDEELRWTGGKTHVVFDGDLLDRGPGERELLDLIMRLEVEAFAAGGRVHVLLGNHEIMNLTRDVRYIPPEGYQAFAADERAKDRKKGWSAYLSRLQKRATPALRAAFDQKYPPGYFARSRAFSPDGIYGSWLLSKPLVIKIDSLVFVHGGLTEEVAELGIDGINKRAHKQLKNYLDSWTDLRRHGVLDVLTDATEVYSALRAFLSPAANHPKRNNRLLRRAAGVVLNANRDLPFASNGPVWYRGNSLESERIERDRLEQVLALLDAKAILVGHTPTKSALITSRFESKLFRIDVGTTYGKDVQALVIEEGQAKVYGKGLDGLQAVTMEGPRGEAWSRGLAQLPDQQIAEFLQSAEIRRIRPLGRGSTRPQLVQLEQGQVRLRALFKTVDLERSGKDGCLTEPEDRYQHEIAAYLLDRMIQLGQVPVTTERRIEQTNGSMQLWVEEAVDPRSVVAYGLTPTDPDRIARLQQHARVFDALIGNLDRDPSDVLTLLETSDLLLVDHSKAFCPDVDIAPSLQAEPCVLDPALQQALMALSPENLRSQLGRWLTKKQRDALLARRDQILASCGS